MVLYELDERGSAWEGVGSCCGERQQFWGGRSGAAVEGFSNVVEGVGAAKVACFCNKAFVCFSLKKICPQPMHQQRERVRALSADM